MKYQVALCRCTYVCIYICDVMEAMARRRRQARRGDSLRAPRRGDSLRARPERPIASCRVVYCLAVSCVVLTQHDGTRVCQIRGGSLSLSLSLPPPHSLSVRLSFSLALSHPYPFPRFSIVHRGRPSLSCIHPSLLCFASPGFRSSASHLMTSSSHHVTLHYITSHHMTS